MMDYYHEVAQNARDELAFRHQRGRADAIEEIRSIILSLRNVAGEAADDGFITSEETAGIADLCTEWGVA